MVRSRQTLRVDLTRKPLRPNEAVSLWRHLHEIPVATLSTAMFANHGELVVVFSSCMVIGSLLEVYEFPWCSLRVSAYGFAKFRKRNAPDRPGATREC
jgi:hypothetical protein